MGQRQKIYKQVDEAEHNKQDLITNIERLKGKIDPKCNSLESLPKAIKQIKKELEHSSNDHNGEKYYIEKMNRLRKSEEFIIERDKYQKKLDEMKEKRKELTRGLPAILKELKALQSEVDEHNKEMDSKFETLDNYDKEIDKVKARIKKEKEDRDKLFKSKDDLENEYFAKLILFRKYERLQQDVEWMTKIQSQLKKSEEMKEQRKKEREERLERQKQEREERKQKEEERKKREEERRLKEQERQKEYEKQLREKELEQLTQFEDSIKDHSIGTNPMFDFIEVCEHLKKVCQKRMQKEEEAEQIEETKTTEKDKKAESQLDKKLAKGSVLLAPSKGEKEDSVFQALGKGKKAKKQPGAASTESKGGLDFQVIRKFNQLKIKPPLDNEDMERALKDLNEVREALVYWGRIIQRQNKIKFIRNTKKLIKEEEYVTEANNEEKFIEAEKAKFTGEGSSDSGVNPDKLKLAQVIDRESRMRSWHEEDFDTSDDEFGITADDMGDEENPLEPTEQPAKKQRPQKKAEPKKTQRPTNKKFAEIMKADDAFPTLENNAEEYGDEEGSEEADKE